VQITSPIEWHDRGGQPLGVVEVPRNRADLLDVQDADLANPAVDPESLDANADGRQSFSCRRRRRAAASGPSFACTF
jgi:hypothetical protein